MADVVILGAGLAGLSASYHIGSHRCVLAERESHPFGHISSIREHGFTWDCGPHISFTKNEYVRQLFEASVCGELYEYTVSAVNYFQGAWIDHPAQTNLYQLPEPLRSECVRSFVEQRRRPQLQPPQNYYEWLIAAYGEKFADTFPAAYTRKYWQCEPRKMGIDWIGNRMYYPKESEVLDGASKPLTYETHYINQVRYPKLGGYQSFAAKLRQSANVLTGSDVVRISLAAKRVYFSDGRSLFYRNLINTIPLPAFVMLCEEANADVLEAARVLNCTKVTLVEVEAPHVTQRSENWIYVYDETMLSTRINCTERLSPNNAPAGWTGIQVEVYSSRNKDATVDNIGPRVVSELVELGLLKAEAVRDPRLNVRCRSVPWANVVFELSTKSALEVIWRWLEGYGLLREHDDTCPTTDWCDGGSRSLGSVVMAGRFGQWKYFWSDDCVLRGRIIGDSLQ